MDADQKQRFADAVARKNAEAKARSEQRPADADAAGGSPVTEEIQASEIDPGRPQDTMSARDKNTGKGKKTADKWNQ
jgi:hypothetical protein